MRKILSVILALITVCCMSALAACGKHEHAYDASKYETDATSHWHVCTGEDCEEVEDKADHTFTTKTSAEKHWQECSCGVKQGEAAIIRFELSDYVPVWVGMKVVGISNDNTVFKGIITAVFIGE